jgi:hypothetical protein
MMMIINRYLQQQPAATTARCSLLPPPPSPSLRSAFLPFPRPFAPAPNGFDDDLVALSSSVISGYHPFLITPDLYDLLARTHARFSSAISGIIHLIY